MTMKGPRPKPIDVKQAMGNPGKEKLNDDAPARLEGEPVPPWGLTGMAQDLWNYYSKILRERGQLGVDSGPALALLCETSAEVLKLRADVDKHGMFQKVVTVKGGVMERARPSYMALGDAQRREQAMLCEFGLTDASRGKVKGKPAAPTNEDDPAVKFDIN